MAKIVLITGGSSGIGKSIGEFLTERGCIVYGTSRQPINYPESKFPLLSLDVKDMNSIETSVQVIIKINVIKAVLPYMREQKAGLIINITSIAGYMGLPFRGIYSSSKGALELITEAFRMELKPFNIHMTNVAPGDFATNIAAGRYHAPLEKDSPYKSAYGKTLDLMNAHVDSGSDPILMAKVIYKIMRTKSPKVHYKVGSPMQKFSIVLKRLLPDTIYERLLMSHYKL